MLKDFKKVIRECEYSNTYKMAWAKAIIELSNKCFDNGNEYSELSLFDIALKMFKYYWDQTIFFNLFQSAPNQLPVILIEETFTNIINQTNFKINKLWINEDKLNRDVKWLNVVIRKDK